MVRGRAADAARPGDVRLANRLLIQWTREQERDIRSPDFGAESRGNARLCGNGGFPTSSLDNAFAAPALAFLFRRCEHDLTDRGMKEATTESGPGTNVRLRV